jgi:hypothetical protein
MDREIMWNSIPLCVSPTSSAWFAEKEKPAPRKVRVFGKNP